MDIKKINKGWKEFKNGLIKQVLGINKKINFKSRKFKIIVVTVLLGVGLYVFRGVFVVASVNNVPIFRWTLLNKVESQYGAQALDSLITKELIVGNTRNVVVDLEDVQKQIEAIRSNFSQYGGTLEEALGSQGMTMADLEEEITLQLKLKEILKNRIEVTKEEVAKYVERTKTKEEEAKAALYEQKLNEEIQKWIGEIKPKSNVVYFGSYVKN